MHDIPSEIRIYVTDFDSWNDSCNYLVIDGNSKKFMESGDRKGSLYNVTAELKKEFVDKYLDCGTTIRIFVSGQYTELK